MNKKVSCVSIDLMDHDKPPASLAFLAGACDMVSADSQLFSLNIEILKKISLEDFNKIHLQTKLKTIDSVPNDILQVMDSMVESIKQFNPDIILISIFSFLQKPYVFEFLKRIRKSLPVTEVLAGGPGVHSRANDKTLGKTLLDQNLIDFYCLGEGDELILEFLRGRRDMLGLNSKKYPTESWVPQLNNLDQSYLFPSYKKISFDQFKNTEGKSSTVLSLVTSRGCVRACSFCDVGHFWKKFRFRSGKNVADEVLKHHQEVGAINFTIVDSLINGSLKSFREFNQEIIKLKIQYPSLDQFSYNGLFIIRNKQSHPEELFKLMKEAGCDSVGVGIETGSDRLRDEMKKGFTNEDIEYHLEMCNKYGIRTFFLMFTGYPTETKEDFNQTLEMLTKWQKYLLNSTIGGISYHGTFLLLPDTPVYEDKDRIGILIDQHQDDLNLKWYNQSNPELTVKERLLRELEFRKHALKLRYPLPWNQRFIKYIKKLSS